MARILCVDDEATPLMVLEDALRQAGHETIGVRNVEAAFNVLGRGAIDLIVSDYRMPEATGLEFLSRLEREGSEVPLIMVTGYGSIQHAVASIKAGALDYITKPVRPHQLQLAVDQALEFIRLRRENRELKQEVSRLRSGVKIVGDAPTFQRILDTLALVAPTRSTVLLQGESGTGKELLARTVHDLSDRAEGAFISLNCAALPEHLVESTLFGHEKGAFTGAVKSMRGAFERAHRGTLLLDEISEMRLDLQAKLLRVLQEQEFERVGGTAPIRVDVRIIATTNRDIQEEVQAGRFREDLFFRLSVVPVLVPPLRERLEDIPLLVQYFARRTAEENGKSLKGIAPQVIELLQEYDWPGNVRELAHEVERAVILCPGEVLTPEVFGRTTFGLAPTSRASGLRRAGGGDRGDGVTEQEGTRTRVFLETLNIANAEEQLIERALEMTGQNRTQAAEILGINVRTLRNKLNRHPE
jgi:DNA-binding NtrC family response regulator